MKLTEHKQEAGSTDMILLNQVEILCRLFDQDGLILLPRAGIFASLFQVKNSKIFCNVEQFDIFGDHKKV